MQEALNVVDKWTIKEGLNISPHYIAIVPFANRRKIEGYHFIERNFKCWMRSSTWK
jgi:hypothetical protein